MKKTYYLFNPGRLSRKDNTLRFTAVDESGKEQKPRYLPVEGVEELYVFGSIDANSSLYNYLGQKGIGLHFFDYYENYTGSFMPREYLLAGRMVVAQTKAYLNRRRRLGLAQRLVEGASHNMLQNLKYYNRRDVDVSAMILAVEQLRGRVKDAQDIEMLMGIEGNIRKSYYAAFDAIIRDFEMGGRSMQPPKNEVNALVSFGNMLCYTQCLRAIYHTQLNPTVSFLHTPGERRYSLALDLAEVFKPVLIDRMVFKLLNRRQLTARSFDVGTGSVLLKESGRQVFLGEFEKRLAETVRHRRLKRNVSYKYLLRLECYKLAKDLLEISDYEPFKTYS